MSEETATLAPPAKGDDRIKIVFTYPQGGYHKGDIRTGKRSEFRKFLTPPVVEQGQKPIPAAARIIQPGDPLYADAPGPATVIEQIVFCADCGLDTRGSKKFCPECGKPIKAK